MRISMPTIFANIQTQLQRLVEDLQHTNATIATGRKYQQISDNPVEVGTLMGLNAESGQITQYQRNLETANNWLSSTENALSNINEIVSQTSALAEQMATGTYNADQRAAAAEQVQQYLEEIMQMGNVRFDGKYLMSGYKIDTEPFTMAANYAIQQPEMHLSSGSDGAATSSGTYTGTGSVTYIVEIVSGGATGAAAFRVSEDGGQTWSATDTSTGAAQNIGTDGAQVTFDPLSANWVAGDRFTISVYKPISYQGDENHLEVSIGRNSTLEVSQVGGEVLGGKNPSVAPDIFQIMSHLKSDLEANDAAGVGARLEELRDYQAHLTSIMAGQGAALNRVEIKQNTYDSLQEEVTQNIATKGDTDLVEAANALAAKQLAYQAALQSSTMVMQLSLLDYL